MENSKIEWTNHTFNPWHGCTKVSPACDHCYAMSMAKRMGQDIWGAKAKRRMLSDDNWIQPVKWNESAKALGERPRVFCGSMCDVCEKREDLVEPRARLVRLIEDTPHLDWLLLSKRPENFTALFPWGEDWPENVWVGATVEQQKYAELRLNHLLRIPAAVRFISSEPLLGPLDLGKWAMNPDYYPLNWIIAGGESGAGARPSAPAWYASLQRQSEKMGAAFHFKQYGNWGVAVPGSSGGNRVTVEGENGNPVELVRYQSKKTAGRMLLGRTWDELPVPLTPRELRELRQVVA